MDFNKPSGCKKIEKFLLDNLNEKEKENRNKEKRTKESKRKIKLLGTFSSPSTTGLGRTSVRVQLMAST